MWLIPTRNRPDGIKAMVACMRACEDVPEAAVMIDLPESDGYGSVDWPSGWCVHNASEHLEFIGCLNALYALHPNEPWYGVLPDHSRPKSNKWSERLVGACAGGFSNPVNTSRISPYTGCPKMGEGVFDASIVRVAGWIFPDWLTHFFGDDTWEEVLQTAGLWHQTDVVIEHDYIRRHPRIFNGVSYHEDDHRKWAEWRAADGVKVMIEKLHAAGVC